MQAVLGHNVNPALRLLDLTEHEGSQVSFEVLGRRKCDKQDTEKLPSAKRAFPVK